MSNLATTTGTALLRPVLRDFFDLDNFFGRNMWDRWDANMPAVNVKEDEKNYVMELVVPGFSKEELKVKVENDMLTVSGETKSDKEETDKNYTRREYRFQSFSRNFHLPDMVKDDAIDAHYENGILQLTIPKTNTPVTKSRDISVN
jgi:HSP20 family protein